MLLFSLLTAAFAADPTDDLPESTVPVAPAPAPDAPLEDPEEPPATPTPEPVPGPAAAPGAPATPAPKGPANQSQIQQAVEAAYGKQVPIQAVCSERVALGAPFTAETVVYGVTQRNIGCKLLGVLVDATQIPLAEALPAAIGGTGFAKLDSKTKIDAISHWTTGILLAYDTVAPGTTPTVKLNSKGGWTSTIPFTEHTAERYTSQDVPGAFTFDSAGKLLSSVRDTGPKYLSAFIMTKYSLSGVDEPTVQTGIASVGQMLTDCFEEKYQNDPAYAGSIRFGWTILANGATGNIGTVAIEGEPADQVPDAKLSACYVAAITDIVWPQGAKGAVSWSFTILRQKL
jgi:hypothetical protein